MKNSLNEQINRELLFSRLEKRVEEMGKYIYGSSSSLIPIQHKETPEQILSSPTIPLGDWMIVESENLPVSQNQKAVSWFRRRFEIPEKMRNKDYCLYCWFGNMEPTGYLETVEGMIYIDGVPYQGIDWNHREVLLPPDFSHNYEHELTIRVNFKKEHTNRRIISLEIREINLQVFHIYYRLKYMLDSVKLMDPNRLETIKFLQLIDSLIRIIPFTDPGSSNFITAIEKLDELFIIPHEFEDKISPTVRAVGHAHLDVAWLWDLETTGRKARQTFSTACRLMEESHEFTFIQSQPQLYEFFRESEPGLFQRIQKYAREGRWETEGSTWVEMDTNIPSGESLARHFIYGKRYFQEYFNYDCKILWLPDTFGFNGNLPQVMKKSGVDYFATSKISWNQYTRFPYDVFRWEGIDGSKVLAHFLTAPHRTGKPWATYNGKLIPSEVKGAWDKFSEKEILDEVLLTYGFGDGGGGPTRQMLAQFPVMKSIPGLPKVIPGKAIETFEKISKTEDSLPKWKGELYLEYHRGTLTSRAEIKKLNRRAEDSLNILEKLISLGILKDRNSMDEVLKNQMDGLWKTLLLNHFHDIIAGSSIHDVNMQSESQLRAVILKSKELIKAEAEKLLCQSPKSTVLFNPHAFPVTDIIEIPAHPEEKEPKKAIRDIKGRTKLIQKSFDRYLATVNMDSMEIRNLCLSSAASKKTGELPTVKVENMTVTNQFYKAKIDKSGQLFSLLDLRTTPQREMIPKGRKANTIVFYEDRPINWDAWDIDEFYREFPLEEMKITRSEWIEKGPVRATFNVFGKFRNSEFVQSISFYAHTPRIDFKILIDWHDKNIIIKTAFPLDINTDEAYYEIPYGYIKRHTHSNRPSDRAAFEVPAQRWAAMFERGCGAALLNDSKYGYSCKDSTLELTLLKSAVYPDPDGEKGAHEFTYSFLPLTTSEPGNEILREASILNLPVQTFKGLRVKDENISHNFSVKSQGNHVVLNTVKPSEDNNNIVLRLYESQNRRGEAVLNIPDEVKLIGEVNLLEQKEVDKTSYVLTQKGKSKTVRLFFKPFEIKTLLLELF